MLEFQEKNLVLNLQTGIFADSKYFINLDVCRDNQCNCGNVILILSKNEKPQKETIDCQFVLNIFKNEIIEYSDKDFHSQSKDKKEVRDFFVENLTTEDWKILRIAYFKFKLNIEEQTKIEDLNYKFSYEDIKDNSLMIQYSDIIPVSPFYVEFEDNEFLVYDNYCKNYNCNCTLIYVEICEIKNGKLIKENINSIGVLEYDYKKKKITVESKNKEEVEFIFNVFKEIFNNIDETFEKRHKKVKDLYKKEILNTISKPQKTNNIGRNDPCICRSGKKYKNCCMKILN